jgi:MOSC domain-containing protein YiiM
MSESLSLRRSIPQVGTVHWIGLRPESRAPLNVVESVAADVASGLSGEKTDGGPDQKRQVTLIQLEHLEVVRRLLGRTAFDPLLAIDPGLLRRNLVVGGINLTALKHQHFQIGQVVLWGTGDCPPCSRMEENLGPGGFCAMRGHGGLTARIVRGGIIRLGDPVQLAAELPVEVESIP